MYLGMYSVHGCLFKLQSLRLESLKPRLPRFLVLTHLHVNRLCYTSWRTIPPTVAAADPILEVLVTARRLIGHAAITTLRDDGEKQAAQAPKQAHMESVWSTGFVLESENVDVTVRTTRRTATVAKEKGALDTVARTTTGPIVTDEGDGRTGQPVRGETPMLAVVMDVIRPATVAKVVDH